MAAKELFFTIILAWTSTGVTKDSVGVKTFFNKISYTKCDLLRNMKAEDVKAVFKRKEMYNDCVKVILNSDEMECLFVAHDFSKKHDIKRKKCIKMSVDRYNKHYTAQKAEFWVGPLWPKCGGHICKKNRKGKLYACIKVKELSKESCP